jgi:outer membrane receptor protein involved in Fe transport
MNKKKRMWTALLALMFAYLTFHAYAGDTGKIAGRVVDKETGEPLIAANVLIVGTPLGAATDREGDYYIINIPPGTYSIRVSYMGYRAEVRTDVLVLVDKTTTLDFELEIQVVEGEQVTVVAHRPDKVETDLTATKQSYDVGSIETLPGMNDVGDIIDLQADVDAGHFRGSRTGEALYLIGGTSIVNPLNNSRAFEPLTIGLEQVEVYTSGFSAEYGNVQSGVINMVSKEGNTEKWETHIDASSTNPYYKTWGGNVYDVDYNDYFELMNSREEWAFGVDPISGTILWTHFGIRFPEYYIPETWVENTWPPITHYPSRRDSLRSANLIRQLWLQSVREMGLEYAKPDYRLEFSTGGPIAENASVFIAGRQNVVQPFIPTGRPNVHRQIMANVVYRPIENIKLKISYNFDNEFDNGITSNYYRWFERVLNVTKETQTAHQFGISMNYVLNPSTFLDIKLSQLNTIERDQIDLLSDSTYTEQYSTQINWRDYTAPNGYQIGKMQSSYGSEKTRTLVFNGSINSQIDKRNLLKAGIQFTSYSIDVDYTYSQSNPANLRYEDYRVSPYEGALYLQDKMEFEGLIANIGLRFDFYNLNTEYFTNKFSPFRNPNFDPDDPGQGSFYDESLAAKEKTKLKSILQPRIGIAFPVSDKSVLHLNYGVFTQRPAFEYIYGQRLKIETIPNYERLGNPQLEPERTIAYDVGLVRTLPFGFYLDVSAYLKDVSNLIQYAIYEDTGGNRYFTFDNREYADVKGFHVNLERNMGMLRGYIRYNWESAKGKSASAIGSGARAEYFEDETRESILPSPDDIYLNYNRLHKLVCNLSIRTPEKTRYSLFGVDVLNRISISSTYRLSSGRPFTWDLTGQGLQMNMRTPTEHDLSIRIEKKIPVRGAMLTFYAEGFNVLNRAVFSYSRVFEDPQNAQNIFKERYMTDRDNLLTQNDFYPYVTSLDGYLYGNQPRHFRFGLAVNF